MKDTLARAWALLFARAIVGFMFFMAGIYKVFEMGALVHAEQLFLPYQETFLPIWTLWIVGSVIPFIELIAGGLLILGWKTRWAAILLGLVLVTVTFGHLLSSPLYAFHEHVLPRLALILLILFVPQTWDRLGIDGWFRQKASSRDSEG